MNGCYIDQVIREAASAIAFPLETTRTTPSIMWMDEDVLCSNDPIPSPLGLQRRAATVDAILDFHDKNRRIALDMIAVDLLRSLQHRPSLFYDCAEIADQIFEALVKMD
ncbi:hypothetical protein NZK35_08675 [Stieleria sp. ICT_E10.1]|nr:hypothetical protein [Stieleria sedimenti]